MRTSVFFVRFFIFSFLSVLVCTWLCFVFLICVNVNQLFERKHIYCFFCFIIRECQAFAKDNFGEEASNIYLLIALRRWWFGDTFFYLSHCFMCRRSINRDFIAMDWPTNSQYSHAYQNYLKNNAFLFACCLLFLKQNLPRWIYQASLNLKLKKDL